MQLRTMESVFTKKTESPSSSTQNYHNVANVTIWFKDAGGIASSASASPQQKIIL